ncbi:hypothetical protein [Streptomyces sp. NPDC058268]|uniref:hypothetical protein n=1 Tax=Streptomyces sp. NPDC058268 TaxID=3346413 RepID=UPI0036ED96FA
MTLRQAARRYWRGAEETARQRVRWLQQAGYVRTSMDARWAGRCVWTTARGVRATGVEVRAPEWPGERLLHRLAMADAAITFELGGARVLSERELRRAESTSRGTAQQAAVALSPTAGSIEDGRGRDRFLCVPLGASGRVHYPDLVVASPRGLVSVEVEISGKSPAELRQVLRGYRDARKVFGQVVYLATEPVMALLHGHVHPGTGVWTDGVAQQVGLLPSGPPEYRPDSPFLVRHFQPKDSGVAYQLDLRQVPDALRVGLPEWRRLRARWESEGPSGVPFLTWWQRRTPS